MDDTVYCKYVLRTNMISIIQYNELSNQYNELLNQSLLLCSQTKSASTESSSSVDKFSTSTTTAAALGTVSAPWYAPPCAS